jgi:mannose-6-phosphate isomerase-like protein (cupin superfamily)
MDFASPPTPLSVISTSVITFIAMRSFNLPRSAKMFDVVHGTLAAQAAVMILRPGQDTGKVSNEHPAAEQWIFVVAGSGRAIVGRRIIALKARTLVLIPKGARHQIKNTSRRRLVTLNFYIPPAYTSAGEVRPANCKRRD